MGGLHTLDLATGAPTLIGSNGISGWQGLASNSGGQLFGITQGNELYSINKATGAATLIGNTGSSLITAVEFDAADTLWAVEFGGQLGTINATPGRSRRSPRRSPTFKA